MATVYDPVSYLLDRANIHDTITLMGIYLDQRNWPGLKAEVFAPEMTVDYTLLFGGESQKVTGEEQVEKWKDQTDHIDSFQHIYTSLFIDLPQPGITSSTPSTAKATSNVSITLIRHNARGGPIQRNGGRVVLELSRTDTTGNPWRVQYFKVEPAWIDGNWDVFSKPDA